jgi:hypothetical protein
MYRHVGNHKVTALLSYTRALFHETFCEAFCVSSSGGKMYDSELERMWQEADVSEFETQLYDFHLICERNGINQLFHD